MYTTTIFKIELKIRSKTTSVAPVADSTATTTAATTSQQQEQLLQSSLLSSSLSTNNMNLMTEEGLCDGRTGTTTIKRNIETVTTAITATATSMVSTSTMPLKAATTSTTAMTPPLHVPGLGQQQQ